MNNSGIMIRVKKINHEMSDNMESVVLKFGGTSLATDNARKLVVKKIIEAKNKYNNIVVVVSAIGRIGNPYSTDSLLGLVEPANKISLREKDLLMSCGEIISTIVMSNLLKDNGMNAEAITGGQAGILTDNKFAEAQVLEVNKDYLTELMKNNIIPIVAGFQGITINGEITTLGRGGSDTTASLLGEALNSKKIEIYTDVDGIMTADPRVCKDAKIIKEISYNEVFQMADSGAKVIHPRAVEIARRAGIPLIVKNTFSTSKGTNITNYASERNYYGGKLLTGIAHINNRIQVYIYNDNLNEQEFFDRLAEENVSIDIINIFPEQKIFTIDISCKERVLNIIKDFQLKYKFIENCSKVTIIGERMTGVPGVMARVIRSLKRKNIEILQTADSLATIACLIRSNDLEEAIQILHKEFELEV